MQGINSQLCMLTEYSLSLAVWSLLEDKEVSMQAVSQPEWQSVRQSIEHIFAFHFNLFKLFSQPNNFMLLLSGMHTYKLFFTSFFLWNCYQTIHQSSSYFLMLPPTLEEYLPLDD